MQLNLFRDSGKTRSIYPEGFRYFPEVIPAQLQERLLKEIHKLPFRNFKFHGFLAHRRVISFGWHYDFSARRLGAAEEMPEFLLALRDQVSELAGLKSGELQHSMVTEYRQGVGIGWHRDKAVFGPVIGISLLSPCVFRLRRMLDKWERARVRLEPGSVYLLTGQARSEWEHSIPPVEALRYSITFRNVL
jgi:alkylated DNA repair dioxygenase AlkB